MSAACPPRIARALLALAGALLAPGRAVAAPPAPPDRRGGLTGVLDDDGGFARAAPSPDALTRYEAAAAWSRAHGGRALLVVDGDAVTFEDLENGYDGRHGHALWSGTKSFACALAVAAEADGKLRLDEPVASALPALRADPRAAAITVRDTLALTTGLADASAILTVDFLSAHPTVRDSYDWITRRAAGLARATPGASFAYHSTHLALFGAFLRARLGGDPVAWLDARVLDPIGFRRTGWQRDPAGNASFSFGVFTTPRSWARFGVLVRDDGVFRGQRILPAGGLARCFRGSEPMPIYGLTWWLNAPLPSERRARVPSALAGLARDGGAFLPGGPEDLVAAVGWKDNRLYVIPSRHLVIVRFGEGDPGFSDPTLLGLLLGERAR